MLTEPVDDFFLQLASSVADIPSPEQFCSWVDLARQGAAGEVVIRVVDEAESAQLNQQYRDQPGATNVLAFAAAESATAQLPESEEALGDLVICAPVVAVEAATQNKVLINHWAHLTIHGVLHLRGFDHQNDSQQQQMESLEIELLSQLDVTNPYVNEIEIDTETETEAEIEKGAAP